MSKRFSNNEQWVIRRSSDFALVAIFKSEKDAKRRLKSLIKTFGSETHFVDLE